MNKNKKLPTKGRHNRRKVKCSSCDRTLCFDSFTKHLKTSHPGRTNAVPLEISTPSVANMFTKIVKVSLHNNTDLFLFHYVDLTVKRLRMFIPIRFNYFLYILYKSNI